jgi:hypothetical protein
MMTSPRAALAFASLAVLTLAPRPTSGAEPRKGAAMSGKAKGPFEVKIAPLALSAVAQDPALGRMSIDKQYHGDLEGTGKGEMLTAGDATSGSAAYVAVERVSGTLGGRKGSFLVYHHATMARGKQSLSIAIVPDSGTGQFSGISGTMNILFQAGGQHAYELEYTLPEAH